MSTSERFGLILVGLEVLVVLYVLARYHRQIAEAIVDHLDAIERRIRCGFLGEHNYRFHEDLSWPEGVTCRRFRCKRCGEFEASIVNPSNPHGYRP